MKKVGYGITLVLIVGSIGITSFLQREGNKGDVEVFMCREVDCEDVYVKKIAAARESLFCAFFEFDLSKVKDAISHATVMKMIYVDGQYTEGNESYLIKEKRSAYMHNKFCVIDRKLVLTGSFNPTQNDRDRNDNNVVVINSKGIAQFYHNYFLYRVRQEKPKKRQYAGQYARGEIEICFTPGDCITSIRKELQKAISSIIFMQFSATDVSVGDLLLAKHYQNVKIQGVMETSQAGKYSFFKKLQYHKVSVIKDCNRGMLHHKVFIIDNTTVVTGSLNPSQNSRSNDENVVIIRNKEIAEKYLNEFARVMNTCAT